MRILYDYNMNPIGYVSENADGKQTAYDTNYRVLGYYFSGSDKTYDNNMRLVGRGDLLSAFYAPTAKR